MKLSTQSLTARLLSLTHFYRGFAACTFFDVITISEGVGSKFDQNCGISAIFLTSRCNCNSA